MPERTLFFYLVLGFIVSTIAGTLSHEAAHYITAKALGFEAGITYKSTIYTASSPERIKTNTERFLITTAGPVQTILTGSIGILLVFFYRSSFRQRSHLKFSQWILIFLSLFWLRQVGILLAWIAKKLNLLKFTNTPDEVKMSRYLGIPDESLILFTGLIGITVLTIIFFRFIPRVHRRTFLIAGIAGCIAGYLFWFEWLGKMVLPR